MSISSIHLSRSREGILVHNARENFSHSVVFTDEENELQNNSAQAHTIYKTKLHERATAYFKSMKQKLQAKANTQMSAVVNLEKYHTIGDLKPLIDHLESHLDTVVYQVGIHRDEGKLVPIDNNMETLFSGKTFFKNPEDDEFYYDIKYSQRIDKSLYRVEKNYHAHLEFMGIDSNGRSIKRKLNRFLLSELQTATAEILGMERGICSLSIDREKQSTIKTKPHKKRLDVDEFKNAGVEQEKERVIHLKEQKQLKEEIGSLNATINKNRNLVEDYRQIEGIFEDLLDELEDKMRLKNMCIEMLKHELDSVNKQLSTPKIVQVEKINEVEKIIEVQKIVEVEKEVVKEVLKTVTIKVEDTTKIEKLQQTINDQRESIQTLNNNLTLTKNELNISRIKETSLTQEEETQIKEKMKVLQNDYNFRGVYKSFNDVYNHMIKLSDIIKKTQNRN